MGFIVLVAISPVRGDDASDRTAKLNGGYYLLHHLCDDESHVPMLFLVKHAPAEITKFADKVSSVAKESLRDLDRMHDNDPAIRLDQNPLPAIEQDTRDSIKADKQHQLLFGSTDSEFVRRFLVSQIEACTYAMHLSKVLAGQETDPGRAKTLNRLSAKWTSVRDETYRILSNY